MEKRTGEAALLLIGHGSRLPYQAEAVSALADRIREEGTWAAVGAGYLEHTHPLISEALEALCHTSGATTVVCVPVFIADGTHLRRDIPRALGLDDGRRTGRVPAAGAQRTLLLLGAIGGDPRLAALLSSNARSALEHGAQGLNTRETETTP
jgi:sirohydrochlorin cobaltochelatase